VRENKGMGINADFINIFSNIVKQDNNTINNKNIISLFNLIFQGKILPAARKFFTDTHLFCLHKDQNDLSKLRPIPTKIRQILASHITITLKDPFGDHLLPYNYTVGINS
jgi:hypothetical protein